MSKAPYKILVVDDSRLIRQSIISIIESSDQLTVVGEAASGKEALEKIPKLKPDLITLDIIMPEMNGLTTLKYIMIFNPTPTIMLSTLTQDGAKITFDALRYGAIDFISKPSQLESQHLHSLKEQSEHIIRKICLAARVRTGAIQYIRINKPKTTALSLQNNFCDRLITIGVGEGGYGSLLKIIPRLKAQSSTAYMIIFYESSEHVDGFIRYLNQCCDLKIQRPTNNTLIEAGVCYINSGEEYVTVHGTRGNLTTHISPAPFSSRRGSIDMLMFSVAETVKRHSLGVILSGSGVDGAEGLEEIIRVGGGAIIQAPVSCLYKSMALSALNMCEAELVVADTEIAKEINDFL